MYILLDAFLLCQLFHKPTQTGPIRLKHTITTVDFTLVSIRRILSILLNQCSLGGFSAHRSGLRDHCRSRKSTAFNVLWFWLSLAEIKTKDPEEYLVVGEMILFSRIFLFDYHLEFLSFFVGVWETGDGMFMAHQFLWLTLASLQNVVYSFSGSTGYRRVASKNSWQGERIAPQTDSLLSLSCAQFLLVPRYL